MSYTARLFVSLMTFALLSVWAVPADAQTVGLRGGLSVDPDQLYFGAHMETGPVYEEIRFRPNIEVGFGDNRTVVALNGEFIDPFELENGTRLHVGAGPAINVVSRDQPNRGNDTNVQAGMNFLFGVSFERNYFAELKIGAIDSPGVKIGFGYTFF